MQPVSFWAGRYVAPEVYRNEEYDTKVDVFSFALILQEVLSLSVLWVLLILDFNYV